MFVRFRRQESLNSGVRLVEKAGVGGRVLRVSLQTKIAMTPVLWRDWVLLYLCNRKEKPIERANYKGMECVSSA